MLCFTKQLQQFIFPKRGDGVTAVTARFVAERNHDGAAFWNALDLAFENPQLGRIDQIVGGIDREQWRANFFQVRAGVVIVRRLQCVEHIVRVIRVDDLIARICRELRQSSRGSALLSVATPDCCS